MSRVDFDAAGSAPSSTSLALPATALAPLAIDPDEPIGGHALPNDHPPWMRDALSLSARARALVANLKPVVVRIVTAWEHRLRSLTIGNRTLRIDASGCYRME